MRVRILETNELEKLQLIDVKTGVNYVGDFIGNADGFKDFNKNEETGEWECEKEVFEWWYDVINSHQLLSDFIEELSQEFGSERVMSVVHSVCANDLETSAQETFDALEQEFDYS